MERQIIYSKEYLEFEASVSDRTREKLRYATTILRTLFPIPTKFVKKLVSSDFYELRISVENEIRVILFAVDNENINLAHRIVFLNGFVKKGNKDYDKEIVKAINILKKVI